MNDQSYPPSPEAKRRIETMLAAAKKRFDTLGQHDHRNGAGRCPVCSLHDHSDRRVAGYLSHKGMGHQGEPVPAWWVECPRCGTGRGRAVKALGIVEWTDLGIALVRDS